MRTWNTSWRHSHSVNDRRGAPRREAHLEARLMFSLSLLDEKPGAESPQASTVFIGHTRNLSETGLALVLYTIRLEDRHLNILDGALRILLDLPTGPVQIHAVTVRCERLDENEAESGYLVGVRITKMSDGEWVRLVNYLRALR